MSYVFFPFGKNIPDMRHGSEQRQTAIGDMEKNFRHENQSSYFTEHTRTIKKCQFVYFSAEMSLYLYVSSSLYRTLNMFP
jgi:hypothetical protein